MGTNPLRRELIVKTTEGAVIGFQYNGHETLNRTMYIFLGVPYGQDTSGKNRFAPPMPAPPRQSPHSANTYGPPCPQGTSFPVLDETASFTHEDCLHLNIWSPAIRSYCSVDCTPKTVLVFFYGREFEHGSNRNYLYNEKVLAAYGDLVVVVPNYRLGVFGFLNGNTSDAPGNVGLLDQHLAIKWVYTNIEGFGGDSKQV